MGSSVSTASSTTTSSVSTRTASSSIPTSSSNTSNSVNNNAVNIIGTTSASLNNVNIQNYVNFNDPIAMLVSKDYPHHIIERKLGPGSGRFIHTYRLRHVETGSVSVIKVMLARIYEDSTSSSNAVTAPVSTISTAASSSNEYIPILSTRELQSQEEELKRMLQLLTQANVNIETTMNKSISVPNNIVAFPKWAISTTSIHQSSTSTSTTTTSSSANNNNSMNNNNSINTRLLQTKAIFLLRPHVYTTLTTRLATRPFLSNIEKMFIVYQLLKSIDILHQSNLCHGHLNCDNIGLSSWNWVSILDLFPTHPNHSQDNNSSSTVKKNNRSSRTTSTATSSSGGGYCIRPICIPDDDPSDWIYYFQERTSTTVTKGGGTKNDVYDTNSNTSGNGSNLTSYTSGVGLGNSDGTTTATTSATIGVPSLLSTAADTNTVSNQQQLLARKSGKSNTTTLSSGGGHQPKRCYLAPERFISKSTNLSMDNDNTNNQPLSLTPAMDIFSLGCIIMELFLNGEPAFDLGDLMEYRRKNGDIPLHSSLSQKLNKIESSAVRAACRHMLQLDPSKRLNAGEYLSRLMSPSLTNMPVLTTGAGGQSTNYQTNNVSIDECNDSTLSASKSSPIPLCHETILFPLLGKIRKYVLSPDARIAIAALYYSKVVHATINVEDKLGESYFHTIVGPMMLSVLGNDENEKDVKDIEGIQFDVSSPIEKVHKEDEKCSYEDDSDRLLSEIETLLQELDIRSSDISEVDYQPKYSNSDKQIEPKIDGTKSDIDDFKPYEFTPGSFRNVVQTPPLASLIIFVQLILSTIRHTQRPYSKIVGLKLLHRLALFSTDEVRLQRIVPTLVSLLNDCDATVRSVTITILTKILSMIENFPPSDAQVFPQYILKNVSHLITDQSLLVRVAFAECIAEMAENAMRFLDTTHAIKLYESIDGEVVEASDSTESTHLMKAVGSAFDNNVADLLPGSPQISKDKDIKSKPSEVDNDASMTALIKSEYDKDLSKLHETVATWVVTITTETSDLSSAVKQALLKDIARLCNFFRNDGVMACILPQILAFLNDRKDWQVRATLCQSLPAVCAFIGRAATEQFVIPCVETALVDEEILVISAALNCLTALVRMGLLSRVVLLGHHDYGSFDHGNFFPGDGILGKYSPLLINPSGNVRFAVASLFVASCEAIGYPDTEVFIWPILRPFSKYKVSYSSIIMEEDILNGVIPPLTLQELKSEIQEVNTQSLKNYLKSLNLDVKHRDTLECNVGSYVKMLSRNMKRCKSSPSKLHGVRLYDGYIEATKSVFCCSIPNQMFSELVSESIPLWYENLKQHSSSTSAISFLNSMPLLSDVYGFGVTQPTDSNVTHLNIQKDCSSFVGDDSLDVLKIEDIKHKYTTTKSLIFGASTRGDWCSSSCIDPGLNSVSSFISKLSSLEVPPLPPRLGCLSDEKDRPYSWHGTVQNNKNEDELVQRSGWWKPKADSFACTSSLNEHVGPVVKLAVSQDQSFFVSASHDGSSKVWETQQLEVLGDMRSSLTYDGHNSDTSSLSNVRINDITVLENSKSVASAASNGTIHVWRVDTSNISNDVRTLSTDTSRKGSLGYSRRSQVSGSSVLRHIDPNEGEILSVAHFNTLTASLVTFATQQGVVHSWDLRSESEPFSLSIKPECGYLTSMAVGQRNWIVAGTNRGFLALWDVRFQKMVKLYQHDSESPILRLGSSFVSIGAESEPRPYVVVGCGLNEAAVFDISNGSCRHCFRVLDPAQSYIDQASIPSAYTSIPVLKNISIPSENKARNVSVNCAIKGLMNDRLCSPEPCIYSFTGRLGNNGLNYLVTGGGDGYIRYWDLSSHKKCFTVSGLPESQQRPTYESIDVSSKSSLYLCRQQPLSKINNVNSSKVPKSIQRGLVRAESRHRDAILDLKKLEYPVKGILSCSRDGYIKLFT